MLEIQLDSCLKFLYKILNYLRNYFANTVKFEILNSICLETVQNKLQLHKF